MKQVVLKCIRFYQRFLSLDTGLLQSVLPTGKVCRFTPSCSEYTYQAINTYGIITGSWLGLKRIIRCHPFTKGGVDPLPKTL